MKTDHDHKMTRCPKLGDEMTFAYCIQESGNLPCARIIGCWQAAFDVETVLRQCLAPDDLEKFRSNPPKDKVASLIELIERAKRQT